VNQSSHYRTEKDIEFLDSNHPIAIVVGAAGFIGSHLIDHLLKLKIQVIGIDDLSSGNIFNLNHAIENENFIFINKKMEDVDASYVLTQLPRLDYGFFVANSKDSRTLFSKGLVIFFELINRVVKSSNRGDKLKILFLSSIDFYDQDLSKSQKELALGEVLFAKLVKENRLNGRVVRLDEVFGPRMDLEQSGVLTRLIKATTLENLINENPVKSFSTRAIFVDDAISLIAKAIFLSATTNKIFDGEQLSPLKIDELKQVLMDPKWHQNESFEFTKLPPWETPNLSKSIKELSWRPKTKVIDALIETLDFFKSHPPKAEKIEDVDNSEELEEESNQEVIEEVKEEPKVPVYTAGEWDNLKKPKMINGWSFKELEEKEKPNSKREFNLLPFFNFVIIWVIVLVGIVYPGFVLLGGKIIIPNSLKKAESEIQNGQYNNAKQELGLGYLSAEEQSNVMSAVSSLSNFGISQKTFQDWTTLSHENVLVFQGVGQTVVLLDKFVSGLERGDLAKTWSQNKILLNENQADLASLLARESSAKNSLFGNVEKSSVQDFYNISNNIILAGDILTSLFPSDSAKQYLVLLQDNKSLKPTGGNLIALVLIKSQDVKVVDVEPLSLSQLDAKLPQNLSPEDLIKTNLKITNLKLTNSNFDSDFQTFSKTFEKLYGQAGGGGVDGVFAVDKTMIEKMINDLGGISLDSGEKINDADGLKTFLDSSDEAKRGEVLKQFLTKVFAVNRLNLFKVAMSLHEGINAKHIELFVNDPILFNRISENNWSGSLMNKPNQPGELNDLTAVEIFDFNSNSQLTQSITDNISVDQQGQINHSLTNQFSSGQAGFSGEALVFLPVGVKVTRIVMGNNDLSGQVNQFVKYGLAGIAVPLNLGAGESKILTINYQLANGLDFGQGNANYHYKFVKQSGTDGNLLKVVLNFPDNIKPVNITESQNNTTLDNDYEQNIQFRK
jgi:nucleoside-diphosphate-sugar epimerase